jgi:hypothetical protein
MYSFNRYCNKLLKRERDSLDFDVIKNENLCNTRLDRHMCCVHLRYIEWM